MAGALGTLNATAKWTPNGGAQVEVPHVRSWEEEGSADNPEYASAQTGGYKARVEGQKDQSFSIECYRDAAYAALPMAEGDIGTIDLHADDAKKITITAAIIDSISVSANPESAEPMGVTIAGSRYGSELPA